MSPIFPGKGPIFFGASFASIPIMKQIFRISIKNFETVKKLVVMLRSTPLLREWSVSLEIVSVENFSVA